MTGELKEKDGDEQSKCPFLSKKKYTVMLLLERRI